MKTLGKPIGNAIGGGESIDNAVVGKIISGLSESIEADDIDFLCDEFSKTSDVQGGEETAWRQFAQPVPLSAENGALLDMHFAGQYGELLQWLMFCVEVNYGDFLPGMENVSLRGVLQGLGTVSQSQSTSRDISTQTG
jgi:hypothetical protein